MEAMIREELIKEAKKLMSYYEDFDKTIIPTLQSFVKACKKRSLAVKLNNLLVRCNALYRDLNEIYKTKSWIPLDELDNKVLSFEKHLNTIQKEYMILTTNNLDENNDENIKRNM